MGLDPAQARLYTYLIDHGPTEVEDLIKELGDVCQALAGLRETGYVIGDPPAAREPRRAFAPLLQDAASRLEQIEHHVQALQDRYSANASYRSAPLVERMTSREEVNAMYERLDRGTQMEWMQLYTAPFMILPPFTPPPEDYDPAQHPRRRMVYERAILSNPGALASIRNSAEWGAEIRLAERLPTKLAISDRRVALTPEVPRGSVPMLHVTSPVLVAALVAEFEREWATASPLEGASSRLASVPPELTNDDLLALQLLIAGEKAETIARALKVSPKTVQRRVKSMCSLAGVGSRTQLVYYATRNWLPQ